MSATLSIMFIALLTASNYRGSHGQDRNTGRRSRSCRASWHDRRIICCCSQSTYLYVLIIQIKLIINYLITIYFNLTSKPRTAGMFLFGPFLASIVILPIWKSATVSQFPHMPLTIANLFTRPITSRKWFSWRRWRNLTLIQEAAVDVQRSPVEPHSTTMDKLFFSSDCLRQHWVNNSVRLVSLCREAYAT